MSTIQLAVPFTKQSTEYTCGVACIQMLCTLQNITVTEEQITAIAQPSEATGTPRTAILATLCSLGIQAKGGLFNLQSVYDSLQRHTPVLANIRDIEDGEGHYVVIVGMSDTHVYIHDPWRTPSLPVETQLFTNCWYGYKANNASKGWGVFIIL